VVRTLTIAEIANSWHLTGMELPQTGRVLDCDRARVAIGQAVVPLVSERAADFLFRCIDSTIGRTERHVPRNLSFKPASRSDLLHPEFDVVVARFQQWVTKRDLQIMRGQRPTQPRMVTSIMAPFHGFVTAGMVVIDLQHYLHQSAWGEIWHCPADGIPTRVAPQLIDPQSVTLMAALERGVFKDTSSELLAHTLNQRGCMTASMLSSMRVYLGANTLAFCQNSDRALADIEVEVAAGCLRPMPTMRIDTIPIMIVTQSVTPTRRYSLSSHTWD
jgi:hypothetical protein